MGPPRALTFTASLGSLAAKSAPLAVIGRPQDLKQYSRKIYDTYNLQSRVNEDVWFEAINRVQDGGSIPVYLNKVIVSALLCRPTRYGCPFGAHDLHRLVKSDCSPVTKSGDSTLCILCEPPALMSYAGAIARAFPLFSMKTSPSSSGLALQNTRGTNTTTRLHVEFIVVPGTSQYGNGSTEWRSLTESEAAFCKDAANAVRLAQRLVDTPPDQMNVSHMIDECKKVYDDLANTIGAAKLSGRDDDTTPEGNDQSTLSFKVIRGEELRSKGFGGIINVGRAAEDPPALAILTYRPSPLNAAAGQLGASPYTTSPVALVGKGIVYDTGGLALKGRTAMQHMKRDMGGSAAVLAAFSLAVRRGFNQTLHALLCLAENSIGPKSVRIDDIITLYSGKTVEVTNPDAEGRLVVSDGVAYARNQLNCGTIVDACTLTGAQATTTGKLHAAVMSNDEQLEHAAVIAGRFSGDLTFPVIYAPEMLISEFSSAVADLKNSVSDRGIPLVAAAGHFIEAASGMNPAENAAAGDPPVPRWLHIDMAATVASGERATGFGPALLASLFGALSADPLVRVVAPPVSEQHAAAMVDEAGSRQQQGADVEMVSHTPEPATAD